jgi:predicted phage-related endonuclease
MITHELTQGSKEWHAYRATHDNASDAPVMMGASGYKTRDQLIAERATGVTPEIDAATQRLFDSGHRFEALARPLAEEIVGQELYPCTGSLEDSRLSASFDGLTMLEDVAFEHKRLNQRLRDALSVDFCTGADLPFEYQIQMEQQCLVSGCAKVLFMASDWDDQDQLIQEFHCWYTPNLELRTKIVAGWEQFHKDVAAWVPPEAKPAPVVGKTPDNLPALLIQVTGAVTASNLPEYRAHALGVIAGINRELKTDQDFATAESTVKWCADVEGRLAAAKEHALSQTASIDELFKTIDDISAEARRTRLELDKLVKARKEEIRGEIVAGGVSGLREHIEALNTRLGKPYMPHVAADFAGAVKGKRTLESLRGAVNNELARVKIESSAIADRIQINLGTLRELAGKHAFLFADASTIVLKAPEDLTMLVKSRIADHDAAEAAKLEQERERIRQEEAAKLQREAERRQ